MTAAAGAGFREVRVVHGRGRGVQRGIVQAALDRHPPVEAFRDDTASHLGATLVRFHDVAWTEVTRRIPLDVLEDPGTRCHSTRWQYAWYSASPLSTRSSMSARTISAVSAIAMTTTFHQRGCAMRNARCVIR